MGRILKLAACNLLRYRRRTFLTALLIALGIVAVLLFVSVAGSFKSLMIGQITGSVIGDLQIHRRGYVASIDNLPLNLNVPRTTRCERSRRCSGSWTRSSPTRRASSSRAMFSNFEETTSIRLNGVDPAAEVQTCPGLPQRLLAGGNPNGLLGPGEILIPDLLAKGMKLKLRAIPSCSSPRT